MADNPPGAFNKFPKLTFSVESGTSGCAKLLPHSGQLWVCFHVVNGLLSNRTACNIL